MKRVETKGRIREIDVAKGLACLLMIAAHIISRRVFTFGTLAAPLFFACSGMNTLLLIEKTRSNRCYDVFHVLFPVLLFFGGSSHIAITQSGRWRIGPELLQLIALAILLLFIFSKLFKNLRQSGILFPLPFLIQQLLPASFLESINGAPLEFVFTRHYPLFPWIGFFLFGVFLLGLKRNRYRWLQAALIIASFLCVAVAKIPVERFGMSLSYILLALLAITVAFSWARWVVGHSGRVMFQWLAEFFALPGRNALMFLYLHFVALRFFASVNFLSSLHLYLFLETLYLFFACWVLLLFYEQVKNEPSLFFPALSLALALALLRWQGLLSWSDRLYVVDMCIGILFAFLYVQLRRRVASRCERKQAVAASVL